MKLSAITAMVLLSVSACFSATYVLDAVNGSDSSGDGSAGSPWASMAKVFTAVSPGDTVLLRPGNYGSVTFGGGAGFGDETGHVTYMADPATTTPRDSDWYENGLDRPDPENPDGKVIFTSIKINYYMNDWDQATKTATPLGHYITLDGLNVVGGNFNIVSFVSHVVIRNCNVFGNWADFSSDITGTAFNLYRSYYYGSNYRHILIEDCYGRDCSGGAMLLGNFYDVTIRGCHFERHQGTMISMQAGDKELVTIEGNHLHNQQPVADTRKHNCVVVAPNASAPNMIFTINSSINYFDYVVVTDSDTTVEELREVASYNSATLEVILTEPLSFNVDAGDTAVFWDGSHGSGISVRSGNFVLRGNRIHDCGSTRGIYFYTPGNDGYSNITIENNLFYSTKNQFTADFYHGLGDNCVIRNNTFAGYLHSNYQTNNDADMYYGLGVINADAAPNADPSTIVFANNLVVGTASAPDGATVKNNIVFAGSGFETDSVGPNANNIVFYGGEPVGSEPHPFDGSGNFFAGSDLFDAIGFSVQHSENFNAAFMLAAGAAAVGYADAALAPETDITEALRDSTPDVGAYELITLRADIDSDGDVDIFDFLILKANFGTTTGATNAQGDCDGDGDVDIFDFLVLKSEYGA